MLRNKIVLIIQHLNNKKYEEVLLLISKIRKGAINCFIFLLVFIAITLSHSTIAISKSDSIKVVNEYHNSHIFNSCKMDLIAKIKTEKELIEESDRLEREKIERLRKKEEEERKQKELMIEADKARQNGQHVVNRGSVNNINIVISFYTNLPEENSGYTITCNGKKLEAGIVASVGRVPLGTQIFIPQLYKELGCQVFTVEDHMNEQIGNGRCSEVEMPLDVLVPPYNGEDEEHYINRVNNMGVRHIQAQLIKWGR